MEQHDAGTAIHEELIKPAYDRYRYILPSWKRATAPPVRS